MSANSLFQYKELITNGLDFLSFLLITREVLEVVQTPLKNIVGNMMMYFVAGTTVGPGLVLTGLLWRDCVRGTTAGNVVFVMTIVGGFALFYGYISKRVVGSVTTIADLVTKKALWIDVALFCLSRLIALCYSLYEVRHIFFFAGPRNVFFTPSGLFS